MMNVKINNSDCDVQIHGMGKTRVLSKSNSINLASIEEIPPITVNKTLRCEGQFCGTSNIDIAQGYCAKAVTTS